IKKVRIDEIRANRNSQPGQYSWWVPGPSGYVEFTSSGLMVKLSAKSPARRLGLSLSTGRYRVAWLEGKTQLASAELRASGISTLEVPLDARGKFDGVLIQPHQPGARFELHQLELSQ